MEKLSKILGDLVKLSLKNKYSFGISHGKMGLCISLFYIAYLLNSKKYIDWAEMILEDMLDKLYIPINPCNLNNYVEFAIGIDYLIGNNYIQCESEDVLSDIDDLIFKYVSNSINTNENKMFSEEMLIVYYFLKRLSSQNSNSKLFFLYKEFVIENVNNIHHRLTEDDLIEPYRYSIDYILPFYLYLIAYLKSLNIYDYKARMIVYDLSNYVLTKVPFSDCNKLYLLWGILHIIKQFDLKEWENHANFLYTYIDIDKALFEELKSNHILFENGISSIYFILKDLKNNFPKYSFNFNLDSIFDKISRSSLWDSIDDISYLENHSGLINGILFPIIVMGDINLMKLYDSLNI